LSDYGKNKKKCYDSLVHSEGSRPCAVNCNGLADGYISVATTTTLKRLIYPIPTSFECKI